MQTRRFSIDTYMEPDEAFHFARKDLAPQAPRFAHDHDYHEVFLVETGAARHWVNGKSQVLDEGSLVFIRPADAHRLRPRRGHNCRIINVMLRNETADHLGHRYADELAGRFFWSQGEVPEVHTLTAPQAERMINLSHELQAAPRRLARIEDFLLSVMTRVVDIDHDVHRHAPPWLIHACQAARRPEVFRRGAAGFVEAAGRGHEHVCRQARVHLGLSPSAYVNRIRMEHAAMLLAAGDAPIAHVAADCGIENMSHFYRLFRDHHGATPRAYRLLHGRDPVQPTH